MTRMRMSDQNFLILVALALLITDRVLEFLAGGEASFAMLGHRALLAFIDGVR